MKQPTVQEYAQFSSTICSIRHFRALIQENKDILECFPHLKIECDALCLPCLDRDYQKLYTPILLGIMDLKYLWHRLDHSKSMYPKYFMPDINAEVVSAATLYNRHDVNKLLDEHCEKASDEHVIELRNRNIIKKFDGWTKHGLQGEILDVSSSQWAALTEKETKLMWAVNWGEKENHSYHRDYDHEVSNGFPNRGNLSWYKSGKQIIKQRIVVKKGFFSSAVEEIDIEQPFESGYYNDGENTQNWINKVNEKGWCGYCDWRLPTSDELKTFLLKINADSSRYSFLFTEAFALLGFFWFSSGYAYNVIGNELYHHRMSLGDGSPFTGQVRLVRSVE